MINHLQKSLVDTNIGIAYIYCNYKEAGQQSLTNLIASLVHQLVRRDSVLASDLASLYESHITKDTRPSRDEYAQLLQVAAASFTKVFIIIDALDECVENDGTRQDLLEELRKLQLKACLLVTSRDLPSIQRQLRSATRLEIQASDDDIMTYLCERISSSEKISMYVKRDPGLHEVIVKTITGKARGM